MTGSSRYSGAPSWKAIWTGQAFQQVVGVVAHQGLGQWVLLVVLRVHEDEVAAVAVQVRGIAPVDRRGLHLHARVVRLVDDLAGEHVLELGAHEGRALAWLDVLELGDLPELSLDLEDEPVLEVCGRCHGVFLS